MLGDGTQVKFGVAANVLKQVFLLAYNRKHDGAADLWDVCCVHNTH